MVVVMVRVVVGVRVEVVRVRENSKVKLTGLSKGGRGLGYLRYLISIHFYGMFEMVV